MNNPIFYGVILFIENIFFYITILKGYENFINILILHVIIASLFSSILLIFMPKNYKKNSNLFITLIFFVFLVIFSSVYGLLFIPFLIIIGLRKPYNHIDLEIKEAEVDYYIQSYPEVYRKFREGSLFNLAEDENITIDNKLKAIQLLAKQNSNLSISILKKMLLDKDEEIRLFSYSSVAKFEKKITLNISRLNKALEKESDILKKANLAKKLAMMYWDLLYFGLTNDDMLDFMVERVEYYAYIALELLEQDEFIYILLSKLYIKIGKYEKAENFLYLAIGLGNVKLKVIPYLAEIYFKTKQYKKLKSIFKENRELLLVDQKIASIIEIWGV